MLVLTRRIGESVKLGDDIRIVVMEIRGKQVRLGVEAPLEIAVHREEIYRRIQAENILAATSSPSDPAHLGKVLGRRGPKNKGRG